MGRIPEHILNEIQDRCDIVEVISGYIPLRQVGRNFKANCPFHHEKTPSFVVSPDKQIYHCFGCNSGGNVLNFVKEYEKIDFIDAVKLLAEKTGIKLPEYKRENNEGDSIIGSIYAVNDIAADYYVKALEGSGEAMEARRYVEKRGLEKNYLKTFKIGYAPQGWSSLTDYLMKRGVNIEVAIKAGLVQKGKNNSFYDLFRKRLTFPIFDVRGRVLGFGARVMDDSSPKYINSPETIVYKKSQNLYGLNFAKPSIREKGFAVITEGYLDVMTSHQYGISNVISSLGTALTMEQIRLLKRYTHNIVMVYDADQAGEMATLRGLDLFLEEGVNVRVATLDSGHDPDSFIRKFGPRGFSERLKRSNSLFTYKLGILNKKFDGRDPETMAEIVKEMLTTISKVRNAVIKAGYIKELSQELSIKEEAIWEELKKTKKIRSFRNAGPDGRVAGKKINISPAEKILVRLMLEDGNVINRVKQDLQPLDFKNPDIKHLVEALFDIGLTSDFIDAGKIINYLEEKVEPYVISFIVNEEMEIKDKDRNISDCIRTIQKERRDERLKDIQNRLVTAQKNGYDDEAKSLLEEFNELIKRRA
ncbi:MAG: DNA primase [Candidatus Omnitrophica bacterium]|nr:DNA primase [Candidatus Omnitrophota bacterium]